MSLSFSYGCSIQIYPTDILLASNPMSLLACSSQIEKEDKTGSWCMHAFATCLPCWWLHRHRPPDTKWQRSPCFRNFHMLILNKADHKLTEKLLQVFACFLFYIYIPNPLISINKTHDTSSFLLILKQKSTNCQLQGANTFAKTYCNVSNHHHYT